MRIPFLLQPNIMITLSKTQRKRIMQNFKIQTSTTLIWFLSRMAFKISNDPDGDDFIVFILTAKKKEKKEGREEGSLITKASSCPQESCFYYGFRTPDWLPTHPREIHLHIFGKVLAQWKCLWSNWEHLGKCCSWVPSDESVHSLFNRWKQWFPRDGLINMMNKKKRDAHINN